MFINHLLLSEARVKQQTIYYWYVCACMHVHVCVCVCLSTCMNLCLEAWKASTLVTSYLPDTQIAKILILRF